MLKISREDIDSEKITDFDTESRFIKLPILPYLKLLDIYDTINKPQIALINAINNPNYRFVNAALARRLGKTYIANCIGQLISLMPGENVLIISPNYNLSSISFELQRSLIKHFGIEVERDNLKDKVIELCNGSTIRMGSISTVDSVVGRSYKLIIFDEAALASAGKDAFNIQLRPTLDRMDSKAIFISTPRGMKNWFSEFYMRGFSSDFPEWASITADYKENARMREEDVAEARRSMSTAEFEQEYLASFNTFEGQIFKINKDRCIREYSAKDNQEFFAGLDAGYRDPTAFVVLQYFEKDGLDYFHVVDEYMDVGTTDVHASRMHEMIDKWGVDMIFRDSAAAQFGADLAYTYDITTIKAKKDVLPGIAYVQSIIEQDRLLVAPHCEHTLAALDQYRWDSREGLQKEKPLHDYSDMMDALRYALYSYVI